MRSLLVLLPVVLLTGCAPDYLPGTYNFTVSSTDTETAPRMMTTTSTAAGTMAVTKGKTVDYVVTLSQTDATPCVLEANANDKGDVVSFTVDQKCTFAATGGGTITATLTSGTVSVAGDKGETGTVEVSYTYVATALGINFAGNGKRTYTGPRR